MAYKIYTKGNYLVIEDTIKNETFYGLSKDVFIDKSNVSKFQYNIYNVKGFNVFGGISIQNILKQDGNNYTAQEWENFYFQNTGSSQGATYDTIQGSEKSILNSTTQPLSIDGVFSGVAELNTYPDVLVTVKTDKEGILKLQLSPDGINWDSTLSYKYDPVLINPPQVIVKANRYFRVIFENTSGEEQTYLRLDTYYGTFDKLTSSLNSPVPQTFGATVTRPLDFNLMVAKGLYQGHETTLKDGINLDIDTGTVPEDIWGVGGVYTGFPSSAEEGQIVVTGADTGTVFYSYLESPDSTQYIFGSIAVSGAGSYLVGHNIFRCNYALFIGAAEAINSSDITIRHSVTTSNIFCVIKGTQGQTFCGAYSVPKGHKAYFDRITGSIRGGNVGATADMFFYWKTQGNSPLLRIPFVLNFGSLYFDDIDYLIPIPQNTDIIPRCTFTTNNNTSIHVSYRIVKVKD